MKVRKELTHYGNGSAADWRFDERLITKTEAAELLGTHLNTINHRQKHKKTNYCVVKLTNKTVRLKLSEVLDTSEMTEEEKAEYKSVHLHRIPGIMTLPTAAEVMGVSLKMVYNLIQGEAGISDLLPCTEQNGHKRIKKADLYAFIEKRTEYNN